MATTGSEKRVFEETLEKTTDKSPNIDEPPQKRSCTDKEVPTKDYTSEIDVGITEFISKHKGFDGVLKQRFSDFLVNEIGPDNSILHLTDTSKPACDQPKEVKEPDTSIFSDVDRDRLANLLETGSNMSSLTYDIDVTVLDKEKRTNIHQAIKFLYPGLGSNTADNESRKVIRVFRNKSSNKNWKTDRSEWCGGDSKYCHFILYKENKDTAQAINLLAKFTRSKPAAFSYSGSKDKRAKTVQKVSAHKISASRLLDSIKSHEDLAVGNFSYEKEQLKLGNHSGNHFTIVLRNTNGEEDEIKKAMESLKAYGFINYFGLQRFGSTSIPTHSVGKEIIHSRWKEAVNLILKSRSGDHDDISECRKEWEKSGDPEKALNKIKRRNCVEFNLLTGLKQCSTNDYVGALSRLPRNTRTMYVHSYQSYVWNLLVSQRIKKYGLKVLPGDLVIPSTVGNADDVKVIPKVLKEEDVDKTCIQDVVIPLPGFDVIFPNNEIKDWYADILKEDDIEMPDFKHRVRDYSCPGSYRRIIVTPSNVSWNIASYDDVKVSLARSDLDVLNKVPEMDPDSVGKYKALIMQFSLPSSAYATMAVREIMKSDTSSGFQSTLNAN